MHENIQKINRRLKIMRKNSRRIKYPEEMINEVQNLVQSGVSRTDLMRDLNVPRSVISKWLRECPHENKIKIIKYPQSDNISKLELTFPNVLPDKIVFPFLPFFVRKHILVLK